jgi:hypothetical protein
MEKRNCSSVTTARRACALYQRCFASSNALRGCEGSPTSRPVSVCIMQGHREEAPHAYYSSPRATLSNSWERQRVEFTTSTRSKTKPPCNYGRHTPCASAHVSSSTPWASLKDRPNGSSAGNPMPLWWCICAILPC